MTVGQRDFDGPRFLGRAYLTGDPFRLLFRRRPGFGQARCVRLQGVHHLVGRGFHIRGGRGEEDDLVPGRGFGPTDAQLILDARTAVDLDPIERLPEARFQQFAVRQLDRLDTVDRRERCFIPLREGGGGASACQSSSATEARS